MYIAFEGIVGTGKSTQSKKLHTHLQQNYPNKQILWTREPGGSEIAEAIRVLVQGTYFEEDMHPLCEAYLYASSRAQVLNTTVLPFLTSGGLVISDRTFITSLAFQGYARMGDIDAVWNVNKSAIANATPDVVVYLYLPLEMALQRTNDHQGDKFEKMGKDFFQKVHEGYLQISTRKDIVPNWVQLDATGTEDEVFAKVLQALNPFLPKID